MSAHSRRRKKLFRTGKQLVKKMRSESHVRTVEMEGVRFINGQPTIGIRVTPHVTEESIKLDLSGMLIWDTGPE